MKHNVRLSILLSVCLLAGCASPFSDSLDYTRIEEGGETLGLEPDFSYAVQAQTPNILVNQAGYEPWEEKTAIFQGQDLEEEFVIYDTGDVIVFQGTLEEAPFASEDSGIYLAVFTDLLREGEYYFYHAALGYSDVFRVEEGIRLSLEQDILHKLQDTGEKKTAQLCYETACILLSLELYGAKQAYPEEVNELLRNNIETLLLAQDQETGSIFESIPGTNAEPAGGNPPISLVATAEFAGIMAMYGTYIRPVDWQLATQCVAAGEEAYRSIQDNLDNVSYDAGYFAAAQLLRQTGRSKYSQAVVRYLGMKEEVKSYTEYDFSIFADVAYLNSLYGVNLERSGAVMQRLREKAEEIAAGSGRSSYYISDERESYDTTGILQDMIFMGVVNYVIANHEYQSILEDHYHYLLGRNPDALCLMEDAGVRTSAEEEQQIGNNICGGMFYLLLQSMK